MAKTNTLTSKYEEIEITITADGEFAFRLDDESVECDSMKQAHDEIDRWKRLQAKSHRTKLSLPCVSAELKKTSITGLHSRTGKFLIAPKIDERRFGSVPTLYADTPEAIAAIRAFQEAVAASEKAQQALDKFQVSNSRGYGPISDTQYDALLAKLKKNYELAKAGKAPTDRGY